MLDTSTDITLQTKLYFKQTSSSQPAKEDTSGQLILINPEDKDLSQQYDRLDVEAFELSYNYKKPKERILILKNTPMFDVLETLEKQSKQLKYTESKPQPIEITKIKPPSQLRSFLKSFFPTTSPKFAITIQDLLDKAVQKGCSEEAKQIIKASQSQEDQENLETAITEYLNTGGTEKTPAPTGERTPNIVSQASSPEAAETPSNPTITEEKTPTPTGKTTRERTPNIVSQASSPEAAGMPNNPTITGETTPAPTTTPLSFWQCLINPLGCCSYAK